MKVASNSVQTAVSALLNILSLTHDGPTCLILQVQWIFLLQKKLQNWSSVCVIISQPELHVCAIVCARGKMLANK